jgi:hypothetical protein
MNLLTQRWTCPLGLPNRPASAICHKLHWHGFDKEHHAMITLYQFEPAFGLPNASPFCLKLETWLRMAGLPYEAPRMTLSAMGRSPKGKLPYIVDEGKPLPTRPSSSTT